MSTRKTNALRINCIGAGPSGLYFAILMKLRNPANEVTVFERNPEGVTHGWGVVFWKDLEASLGRSDPSSAREIMDRAFRWNGQIVDVQGKRRMRSEHSGFGLCRQELLRILTRRARGLGVEIRFAHEIPEAATLADADLIVAADGAGSLLRLTTVGFAPDILGGRNRYVWLGTSRVFSAFTFGFVPTEAGWIWCHAYAFKDDMSTFIVECAPETWAGLGFDRLNAAESLRLLEMLFARHLDGHRLTERNGKGLGLTWLNFRHVTNPRWSVGKVVLVGDAAHTTHFAIGSGTRLAIEDSIALAEAIDGHADLPSALAAYESVRRQALLQPQREARLSARWFEALPRYIGLDAPEFLDLLLNRRSRVMPHLPPRLYERARTASLKFPALEGLYRRAVGRRGQSPAPRPHS